MREIALCVLVVLCLTCAVLEFSCLRAHDIPDTALGMTGRRLAIVGWLFFCGRLAQVLIEDLENNVPWLSMLAFACLCLGNIARCVNRLCMPMGARQ